MVLSRFNDLNYFMTLPFAEGFALIEQAKEQETETKLWQRWLVELPYFKEFIPFEDYLRRMTAKPISQRPAEDLLAEAEAIEKRIRG